MIPWLKETFDYDVVCCCVNCGQGNELDGLEERAKLSGASKLYIEDIVDDFCDNYIMPCVEAGAVYEHKYLLGTSMARPAIAKKLVEIARKENAVAICHGATGKGNDQIRFELGIKALAPDIKIIAPWRMTCLLYTSFHCHYDKFICHSLYLHNIIDNFTCQQVFYIFPKQPCNPVISLLKTAFPVFLLTLCKNIFEIFYIFHLFNSSHN